MKRLVLAAVAFAFVAAGCGGDNGSSSGPVTLTLITHDAFAYTTDPNVFDQFTQQTGDLPREWDKLKPVLDELNARPDGNASTDLNQPLVGCGAPLGLRQSEEIVGVLEQRNTQLS